MIDSNRLIVETAELVVDTEKDLINLDAQPAEYRKKAESVNRCLRFLRTSEKKLFALQQKLLSDAEREKDAFSFVKPYPPDLNLLNNELLVICKKSSPDLFKQFVEPALAIEREKEKQKMAEQKARGEVVNQDNVIHWIPRVVDAIIFLHAPYEIFPFLNSVRETTCLIDDDERRAYLLNYMERWIYKFAHFLHSYATGLAADALLTICFLGQHQHYPVILEVIKFLHYEENWEGLNESKIQRYNIVRLFLLFKKVLYLHLKRKQNVPPSFNAILSEFIQTFIVEDVEFENNPLMIITLGFYNEPQRFQFLANLKKKKLEGFIDLYHQLVTLADPTSTQPHSFKVKYLEILKTMRKIIKKSHMLTDPTIPTTIRSMLKRELSRQILTEKSFATQQGSVKKSRALSAEEKLAQLQQRAQAAPRKEPVADVKAAALSPEGAGKAKTKVKGQGKGKGKAAPVIAAPPPNLEITVYRDIPLEIGMEYMETPFALFPDQISQLAGWNYEDVSIFQCKDTLFYLLGNFKSRGSLKFGEMLEFARIPFFFERLSKAQDRHLVPVNLAHMLAMGMSGEEIEAALSAMQNSFQLVEAEIELIKELLPALMQDNALGDLARLAPDDRDALLWDGKIEAEFFFEQYDQACPSLLKHFPYFQQLPLYWELLDEVLFGIAKQLDEGNCASSYEHLSSSALEQHLATQQSSVFTRFIKEINSRHEEGFLAEYLPPKLADLLEYKITPDLMDLCEIKPVQL